MLTPFPPPSAGQRALRLCLLSLLAVVLSFLAALPGCERAAEDPIPVTAAAPLDVLESTARPAAEPRERILSPPADLAEWGLEDLAGYRDFGEESGDPLLVLRKVDQALIDRVQAVRMDPDSKPIDKWRAERAAERTVTLPGPFRADECNRVQVEAIVRSRSKLRIQWMRDGKAVVGQRPPVIPSLAPQVIEADFPALERFGASFDSLEIAFQPHTGEVALLEIVLVHEPIDSWYPRPGDTAEPLTVEHDSRPANVLTQDTVLGGSFEATGDHRLRCSYAVPQPLRALAGAGRLVIALAGREIEFPLAREADEPVWRAIDLALDEFIQESPARIEWRVTLRGVEHPDARVFLAEPRVLVPREEARTVLLVTSDTHRGDHLGVAPRSAPVHTPELDALAARGVLFEQALSTSNITMPSHVALLTGVHPRDTGIVDNRTHLSERAETLAEAFGSAGFRTYAAVSAAHLGSPVAGVGQGFDRHAGPGGIARTADVTIDQLLGWLEESEGEPVFVWLHLFDAHGPYMPPPGYENEAPVPGVENETRAANIRNYRGEVGFVDAQLGRVLELPRVENAVVAVTSDHGEVLGNHDIWFEHARLYMDTVHVPLILAWPGGPSGTRVAARVDHLDLGRTLLDLAGLAGTDFPGRNLMAKGVSDDERPRYAISTRGQSASVTRGEWHLILNLEEHERGVVASENALRERHQVELFDLSKDPGSRVDVVDEHREQAALLRQGLIGWLHQTEDRGWSNEVELTATDLAELQALGYTGDATETEAGWIDPDCACDWCSRYP